MDETQRYRSAEDVLGTFIEEECIVRDDQKVYAAELLAAYSRWCVNGGEQPLSRKRLAAALDRRGFPLRRGGGGAWIRVGICLAVRDSSGDPRAFRALTPNCGKSTEDLAEEAEQ
jgi:phage/plasmid-associated DNA primase